LDLGNIPGTSIPYLVDYIGVGVEHTCALLHQGDVKCWGDGFYGQTGLATSQDFSDNPDEPISASSPVGASNINPLVTTGSPVVSLSVDRYGTALNLASGAVKAIGVRALNQNFSPSGCCGSIDTGIGNNADELVSVITPIVLGGPVSHITRMGPSGLFSNLCGVLNSGELICVGGDAGLSANGDFVNGSGVVPRGNYLGVIGDNESPEFYGNAPSPVSGTNIANIYLGRTGHFLLTNTSRLFGWGDGRGAIFADSAVSGATIGDNELPIELNIGSRSISDVAGGRFSACALLTDNSVVCWGTNEFGQLGIDSTARYGEVSGQNPGNATAVNLGQTAVAITGQRHFYCAHLSNATAKCWGQNNRGQLGIGNTNTMGDATGEMAALPTINFGTGGSGSARTLVKIVAGAEHTCAIVRDPDDSNRQKLLCWGYQNSGRLGNGLSSNVNVTSPPATAVNFGATTNEVVEVALGDQFTCARLSTGGVRCFGDNSAGQLGTGNTTSPVSSPGSDISLPGGLPATKLVAGLQHACALLSDQSVTCWGTSEANGMQNGGQSVGRNQSPAAVVNNGGRLDFGGKAVVDIGASQFNTYVKFAGSNEFVVVGNGYRILFQNQAPSQLNFSLQ
jgi:alpha-tubulin suppressor-like RCC1 family protein